MSMAKTQKRCRAPIYVATTIMTPPLAGFISCWELRKSDGPTVSSVTQAAQTQTLTSPARRAAGLIPSKIFGMNKEDS